ILHLPKATGEQAEQNPWRQFFFHSNPTHPLRRCTTLRRGRRCPTRTTCKSATRRRAASTHACSRRCAAFAATRRASAASTASAAAATRPGRRRPQGAAAEIHRPPPPFIISICVLCLSSMRTVSDIAVILYVQDKAITVNIDYGLCCILI
uniref:Uncharacterized protein n=1 Tax=Triticum urartu TaxID=4572 RepID=A0A8R7UY99_TRIUA